MSRKIKLLVPIVLVTIIAAYFLNSYLVKRDFDILCREHSSVLQKKASGDLSQLTYQMSMNIEKSLITPPVKRAFEALADADPMSRHELYQRTAIELGYEGWSCPAMIRLFEGD